MESNTISLEIDQNIAMDIEQLTNGGFLPLKTFLNSEDLNSVLENMRLSNGKIWPIPIIFPKPNSQHITQNTTLLLKFMGQNFAKLEVSEVFKFDINKLVKLFFGTDDITHPGVFETKKLSNVFITGNLSKFRKLSEILSMADTKEPKEIKEIIIDKKWKKIVGFHTRNPPHRAHEFLQKSVLENSDGLLIHPVVGAKKKGDFSNNAIMNSYKIFVKKYLPTDRVILSPLLTYSRYAGPREAVFTAIVRRNYGCTHFIVGRDHTGVKNFYGKYDSQKIFTKLNDVGIKIICFNEPYFCKKCDTVTTIDYCNHDKLQHVEISGTIIREAIQNKTEISDIYIRKEVLQELQKMQNVFIN